MADVTITGYDNEDIVRPFSLVTGNIASPTALNLTNYDIESDIVDAKTKAVVFRMTTNELDNHILIVDAVNGLISITIPHGSIPFNAKQRLSFDLLLKSKSDGSFRRLFGGPVDILDGYTNPV